MKEKKAIIEWHNERFSFENKSLNEEIERTIANKKQTSKKKKKIKCKFAHKEET